jgi:DNA replication and repair protein RecF
MPLKKINLNNFRSFDNLTKTLGTKNLIIGKNGAGKSSLLEAIFFLFNSKSFRTSSLNSLINFDSPNLVAEGLFNDLKISIYKEKGGRLKNRSEAPENEKTILPMVINNFSLNLLEAPKENRRLFVDYLLFHVEQDYKKNYSYFKKALAQRNRALKKGSLNEVKSWTNVFVDTSLLITKSKLNLITFFIENFGSFLTSIDLPESLKKKYEAVTIKYYQGWEKNLLEELREVYSKDKIRGYSSLGPQISDLSIKINSQDSGNILSRGEQKVLILLIYLFFINNKYESNIDEFILLVDDLPSELDDINLEIALKALRKTKCQLFITSLERIEKYEFDCVIDL